MLELDSVVENKIFPSLLNNVDNNIYDYEVFDAIKHLFGIEVTKSSRVELLRVLRIVANLHKQCGGNNESFEKELKKVLFLFQEPISSFFVGSVKVSLYDYDECNLLVTVTRENSVPHFCGRLYDKLNKGRSSYSIFDSVSGEHEGCIFISAILAEKNFVTSTSNSIRDICLIVNLNGELKEFYCTDWYYVEYEHPKTFYIFDAVEGGFVALKHEH